MTRKIKERINRMTPNSHECRTSVRGFWVVVDGGEQIEPEE
jgi:hypothetical protein